MITCTDNKIFNRKTFVNNGCERLKELTKKGLVVQAQFHFNLSFMGNIPFQYNVFNSLTYFMNYLQFTLNNDLS